MTIKEVCQKYTIERAELARKFKIPLRTVQQWYAGDRNPPAYVVAMMIQILESEESNEPLNLEELKKMDGEPVWVHNLEVDKSFWVLAYKDVVSNRLGYLDYANYGKTWIAYTHKRM